MSNIKALDMLRDYSHLDDDKWTLETGEIIHMYGSKPNDPNAINWGEQWRKIADEIEQEIAERYIELPVDADGVPIHVGDKMRFCDFNVQCAAVSPERIYYWDEYSNGHWVKGRDCCHVKPRTIEDVLYECFHDCMYKYPTGIEAIIAKYADEIRGMMA